MATQEILLYNIDNACLIVECKTGIVYRNQVGGQVCYQAQQEGAVAPLDVPVAIMDSLETYAFPQGRRGIDLKTADLIDSLLSENVSTSFLSVDRERLDQSWEAWIYVRIERSPERFVLGDSQGYHGPLFGFPAGRGVITWNNSD